MTAYLAPSWESGRDLFRRNTTGEVVMLNLLRLREIADYSATPELDPDQPINGAEAFDRYVAHTLPYLESSGGSLLFIGEGGPFFIGPEAERWDRAMLIRQSSVQNFLAFASHEGYLAGYGHRLAAVEDSRLLPLIQMPSVTGGKRAA
ncbi:DUF1330 domain-containing protein [Bosea sp. F3-2]|uniref:DUF1330 domain-containing protein n=1 Tax=Bosea sp. F3-2 TaxID=2599640 RepID=UPI0011EF7CD5|nr:DUF1330 domain-containing protein [Bosea sp. F3-2]QEL21225.1 DUF1330 domain-containing protein [Bosea sp. F3-2]